MIKFVLAFIAIILMILGIYSYTNQNSEENTPTPAASEKKTEVKEIEKLSVVTQVLKEKKSSEKSLTVKAPNIVSENQIQEIRNEEDMGKGLTLESIENANVSDEEKELLIADMVYHQTNSNAPAKVLTFEEGLKLIADDVKNGIIE